MPFSQLVALMKANTGRVRLFVAVICRPFAMDECFSSSDGAKLRVDGRDSFPSPSLRALLFQLSRRALRDGRDSFPSPSLRAPYRRGRGMPKHDGRDSFPSPSLREAVAKVVAAQRLDGRDSFPSPSLRVLRRGIRLGCYLQWTGFFPVPFVEGFPTPWETTASSDGRDSFPSPSLRASPRRPLMVRTAMDGILSRPLR